LTSNRITALNPAHTGDLHQVVARLASPVEPAGDVVGQLQASSTIRRVGRWNCADEIGRSFELAEHVGDVRVFRVR